MIVALSLCTLTLPATAVLTQDCSKMPSLKAKRLCKEQQQQQQKLKQKQQKDPEEEWNFESFDTLVEVKELTEDITTETQPVLATSPQPPTEKGPRIYTVPPSTTPRDLFAEDLPNCDELVDEEPEEGFNCVKVVVEPPEIRWRDTVMERLLSQLWEDYQSRLNFNPELYGISLDPLKVDPLLSKGGISENVATPALSADLTMNNIQIHGISSIYLSESLVTRSESLSDMDLKMQFSFDTFSVNGTYSLQGWLGWFKMDSMGIQPFEISVTNATISPRVRLDTSLEGDRAGCGKDGRVRITEMEIPLKYDDISFNLHNLGTFYNTAVNALGIYLIKTQEEALVWLLKEMVKREVNSLIC